MIRGACGWQLESLAGKCASRHELGLPKWFTALSRLSALSTDGVSASAVRSATLLVVCEAWRSAAIADTLRLTAKHRLGHRSRSNQGLGGRGDGLRPTLGMEGVCRGVV